MADQRGRPDGAGRQRLHRVRLAVHGAHQGAFHASGKFWIYDTIDTRDVVIGGTEQDDVSKVTVTDANGNIVPADISIDDSIDGKRVVKAHATAPHSGSTR